jgi:hypothetical protein
MSIHRSTRVSDFVPRISCLARSSLRTVHQWTDAGKIIWAPGSARKRPTRKMIPEHPNPLRNLFCRLGIRSRPRGVGQPKGLAGRARRNLTGNSATVHFPLPTDLFAVNRGDEIRDGSADAIIEHPRCPRRHRPVQRASLQNNLVRRDFRRHQSVLRGRVKPRTTGLSVAQSPAVPTP